jgi:hypothetical protein
MYEQEIDINNNLADILYQSQDYFFNKDSRSADRQASGICLLKIIQMKL